MHSNFFDDELNHRRQMCMLLLGHIQRRRVFNNML